MSPLLPIRFENAADLSDGQKRFRDTGATGSASHCSSGDNEVAAEGIAGILEDGASDRDGIDETIKAAPAPVGIPLGKSTSRAATIAAKHVSTAGRVDRR
jgi:hypothetical protein